MRGMPNIALSAKADGRLRPASENPETFQSSKQLLTVEFGGPRMRLMPR